MRELFQQAINDVQTRGNVNSISTKDGRECHIEWYDKTLMDADGHVMGLLYIGQDITERIRVEDALKKSEERLRAIMEAMPDLVFVLDEDGRYLEILAADESLLAADAANIKGRLMHDVLPPTAAADSLKAVRQALDSGELLVREYELDVLGGHRHFESRIAPLHLTLNGKRAVVSAARDITDRKLADQALRIEKDRAQRYLDVAGIMFIALDTQGEVTLANRRGNEILGMTQEAIIGKNWFDSFIPARNREEVRAYFNRLVASEIEGIAYNENPILTTDGVERIIAWHNTILVDAEGTITGTLSSGEDITERKQAEALVLKLNAELEERIEQRTAELAQASERLELATRSARVGVWDWDIQNDVLAWDDTVCGLFDVTRDDFQGNHAAFLQRLHPEDADKVDRQIAAAFRGDKHYANEFRIVLPDGTLRYLRSVASVTYAPDREAVRMIGVNWDITESKRAELELQLFNEVMVGREERIIELKEEVNRLAAELGQDVPYPPVWQAGGFDLETA